MNIHIAIKVKVGASRANETPTPKWQRPIMIWPPINRALLVKVLAVQIDIPEEARLIRPIKSVPVRGLMPPVLADRMVLE